MASQTVDTNDHGIRKHIPLLSILMLGLFIAILNQTLLSVAMPRMMTDFNVTATTIQWLSTGFMLVNGALIPLSAFLIERFGTRSLFILAMTLFTIGTFICGIAPTFTVILIGRLIQAAGGGILQPLVMTIIMFIFPPEIRGRGMGIFGLAMMFAPAIGPTLSGWTIEHYSWRVMFYGMVPLGIIVIIIALFTLKNLLEPKMVKLDLLGAFLSLLGVASLLYGVSEAGSNGWTDPIVLTTIVIGLAAITVFVIQQLKSEKPLLDFRVFKYDMFSLSNVISAIITVAMFTGLFLLPIYLQNLRGFTPLESGLLMLPGALVMAAMSPISGVLFDKVGPRPLAIVGLVITVLTTYEFTKLTPETGYSTLVVIYMIRSLGMSLLMMPIMTAGMNQLPERLNAHGTAMTNTIRQVTGAIGTSLVTTIYTNRTAFHATTLGNEMSTTDPAFAQTFQSLVQSIMESMHQTAEQARQTAMTLISGQIQLQSNVLGINDAFFWATGFAVAGLVLSLFLRDVRKDKKREEAKRRKEIPLLPSPINESK
ncbi:DHA2 family efflux MFS transporter permease subunit [Peribacillus cavernae]|uniref:DHA2 family efflux MFS transporter permease subunit n=1 Tax=Peribacillus cavernae TaxID=1674310 RepID=A0A3S0TWV4_9BACI|nr:DHA2 family efflux MFS transporter permease subunit [Peribacillus cavernae]MDQ0220834.1 EmrB/QacA subfamily drug resistance transporter [Peribacillus cavernae]RUQ24842.1 DHA2 family efflux MFS transporter permease subunit [Peribacillus cavernae]